MSGHAAPGSSEHSSDRSSQTSINIGSIPQLERNFEITARIPHLRNVFAHSPTQSCNLSRYDYSSRWQVLDTEYFSIDCSQENIERCQTVVDRIITGTSGFLATRLVIIEDICSNMIRLFSEHSGLDVEFFEEHLINCGWTGPEASDRSSDPKASTWRSRRLRKSYTSLSWYRPYLARTDVDIKDMSYDISTRSVSIKSSRDSANWTAQLNTWRPHVDLRALESSWDHHEKTSQNWTHNQALGWQERASVIVVDLQAGTQLVLVLIDTSFTAHCHGDFRLRRAMPRPEHVPDSAAIDGEQDDREHSLNGSSSPERNQPGTIGNVGTHLQDSGTSPGEGRSLNSCCSLPRVSEVETSATPAAAASPPPQSFRRPRIRGQEAHPFINVATRGPAFAASINGSDRLRHLALSTETLGDFWAWLEHADAKQACQDRALGPISTLFMIPFYDTIDFLEMVNGFLDDVIESAQDSFNVELHIRKWRRLLDLLSTEFRQMATAFPAFSSFLCTKLVTDQDPTAVTPALGTEIDEARAKVVMEIQRTAQRLDRALQSLMNSLSIAASQRSITEAESIAKLTELAFVYVPFTFAAGVFGMNVVEIDSSKTSITNFVIVAVMLVIMSYCVRLLIRSSTITTAKQTLMSDVRESSRTPPGLPVRTRDFLAWGVPGYRAVYHALRSEQIPAGWRLYTLLSLTIAAAYLLPLSSVWRRSELVSSVKAAISIAAILPLICGLIGIFLYQVMSGERVNSFLRRDPRRKPSILLSRYHGAEINTDDETLLRWSP